MSTSKLFWWSWCEVAKVEKKGRREGWKRNKQDCTYDQGSLRTTTSIDCLQSSSMMYHMHM
jgi:hypothetical protein